MLERLVRSYSDVQVDGRWSIITTDEVEEAFAKAGYNLNLNNIENDREYAIVKDDTVLVYWLEKRLNSTWFAADIMNRVEYEEAYEEFIRFEDED